MTEKEEDLLKASSPLEMMTQTAQAALEDAGFGAHQKTEIDYLVVVRGVGNPLRGLPQSYQQQIPESGAVQYLTGQSQILPRALSQRLGLTPSQLFYTSVGGNTPQMLVNATAEKIARGEVGVALFSGAEALSTATRAIKTKTKLNWDLSNPQQSPIYSEERAAFNALEEKHRLNLPVNIYPLFENALRGYYDLTLAQHRARIGQLFSQFSQVAAHHPGAWFPQVRSAEEISAITPQNRLINFPYTKLMNAMLRVNQSASLVMTSVSKAKALGISPDQWIYLHGCGDANDHWYVSERVNYYTSPAIATLGKRTLEMANCSIDEIDFFDFYSCFPSLVQITRDMLEVSEDDPRQLTVTGGLPYHGGPGNNYVMHAIATMMAILRNHPGKRGLITGNGWYVTKHSMGIYGNAPREPYRLWERTHPADDQKAIDAQPHPAVVAYPTGKGTVETYTVLFDRNNQPNLGIIIGRLEDGSRFVANTPHDLTLLENLVAEDPLSIPGEIQQHKGSNVFMPH